MLINFNDLSDNAKVFIYQTDRKLTDIEVISIEKKVVDFVQNWTSHGAIVKGFAKIYYNYFIVLFADETEGNISGCSKDSAVKIIKEIEQEYKLDLFNRLRLAYKNNKDIKVISVAEISTLTVETIIFNNLVETKNEFVKNWETTINNTRYIELM